MTTAFDPVPDADDRPIGTGPGTALVPYRARPRVSVWGRIFRWWLGLGLAAFLTVALCALLGFHHMDFAPLHIVVDGNDLSDGITINGLSDGGRALLALAATALALLVILLIPVLILLIVASVVLGLICGIGVPLIVLALALGAVTSPIWMVVLLVWLLARRRDSHRLAGSATMAA